jgi:hypothetical protein
MVSIRLGLANTKRKPRRVIPMLTDRGKGSAAQSFPDCAWQGRSSATTAGQQVSSKSHRRDETGLIRSHGKVETIPSRSRVEDETSMRPWRVSPLDHEITLKRLFTPSEKSAPFCLAVPISPARLPYVGARAVASVPASSQLGRRRQNTAGDPGEIRQKKEAIPIFWDYKIGNSNILGSQNGKTRISGT